MFYWISSIIGRLFAKNTFYIYSIKTRFKNWCQIRFTKSLISLDESSEFKINTNNSKIAIIALFPRKQILPSVKRLISAVENNGYHCILVVNESLIATSWINQLQSDSRTIIRRKNIGRDFGAYAEGFKYLQSKKFLDKTKKLLFANDSVYYLNDSHKLINEILQHDKPWTSMFVNYQYHAHAQSFFQIFDHEIFTTPYFNEFWEKYYPSDLRHLAINLGEIKLSEILQMNGHTPEPFITAEKILDSQIFEDFTLDEVFAIWPNRGYSAGKLSNITKCENAFQLKRSFIETNPTHHAGLISSRILQAPLKLDIIQSGQVTPSAVSKTLELGNCSESEIHNLMLYMLQRGTHVSRKGIKKLWFTYGYI